MLDCYGENTTMEGVKESQLSDAQGVNKVITKGGTRIFEQRYKDEEHRSRKAFQAMEIANARTGVVLYLTY